jgi:3-deoxy-D-manno-octulosonic-acid transferase
MLLLFYHLLNYCLHLVAAPFLLFHPKMRAGKRQRWGLYDENVKAHLAQRPGPRLLFHGASAGDLLALRPVIDRLSAARPDAVVLVSTITNSGMAMAQRECPGAAALIYFPYDLPGPVRRCLDALRPDVVVLEYTELWPIFVTETSRRGVRLVLHNGRISPMNMWRYRALFGLTGNLLQCLSLLLMREDSEAERALRLAADPAHVRVTGNTKFDHLQNRVTLALVARKFKPFFEGRGPLWVCGSIHRGEETVLLETFAALREQFPALCIAIAPRYVELAPTVLQLAAAKGYTVTRRSAATGSPAPQHDVFVLDTIGELIDLYLEATVVFVGGSFTRRGGQNITEPAACGKPVLFGPHMENFVEAVEMLQGRGGIQVRDPHQLEKVLADLLDRPASARQLGDLARQTVAKVSGAAQRNAELIVGLLPPAHAAGGSSAGPDSAPRSG